MQGLDVEECNKAWKAKQAERNRDSERVNTNNDDNSSLLNDSPTKSINFNPSPADCGESQHQQQQSPNKKKNKKRSK